MNDPMTNKLTANEFTIIEQRILNSINSRGTSGTFNVPEIARETNVSFSTVRRAVGMLKSKGALTTHYNRSLKRISFVSHLIIEAPIIQQRQHTDHYYQRYYTLNTHPELGGWRQVGLKQRKIKEWMKEFKLSEEDILDSLCYAAYDLNHNDKKESVRDAISWFYKIIEQSRHYRQPPNYQTYMEIDIEKEKKRTERIEKQIADFKKVRQDKFQAEHRLRFEKILSEPDSPEYKACLDNVSFQVPENKKNINDPLFLTALAKSYKKLNNLEEFEWRQ